MIQTIKKLMGMGPKVNYEALIKAGAVILDVRSASEYKGGHAKGSINVPLDRIGDYVAKNKNKDQVIITCCASGMRSGSARASLEKAGYTQVYNGGSWTNVNY